MATADELKEKLRDTTTFARFLANPRAVTQELGGDPDDAESARALEQMANAGRESLARTSGGMRTMADKEWGIGAGCCNDRTLTS